MVNVVTVLTAIYNFFRGLFSIIDFIFDFFVGIVNFLGSAFNWLTGLSSLFPASVSGMIVIVICLAVVLLILGR